jgi:hypothetical protein
MEVIGERRKLRHACGKGPPRGDVRGNAWIGLPGGQKCREGHDSDKC